MTRGLWAVLGSGASVLAGVALLLTKLVVPHPEAPTQERSVELQLQMFLAGVLLIGGVLVMAAVVWQTRRAERAAAAPPGSTTLSRAVHALRVAFPATRGEWIEVLVSRRSAAIAFLLVAGVLFVAVGIFSGGRVLSLGEDRALYDYTRNHEIGFGYCSVAAAGGMPDELAVTVVCAKALLWERVQFIAHSVAAVAMWLALLLARGRGAAPVTAARDRRA